MIQAAGNDRESDLSSAELAAPLVSAGTAQTAAVPGRVPFRKSLYFRFFTTLLAIILVVSTAQLFLVAALFRPLIAHVDQQVQWNLAADLAERLQPMVANKLEPAEVQRALFSYAFMNPKVDFYLLDDQGKILAELAMIGGPQRIASVAVGPIQKFLTQQPSLLPLFGDDPRSDGAGTSAGERAFSAAPMTIAGKPGYLYLILENQPYRLFIRATGMFYVLGSTIVVVLMIAAAGALLEYFALSHLLKNFRVLGAAVRKFQDGEFATRVPAPGADELGILGKVFNDMASTIQDQTERLKESDSLRRQLVANISHDLRSPLTSIQGLLETIQRKRASLPIEEQERYIGIALDSVQVQKRLVDDLFELSKLQANDRTPQFELVSLTELAHDITVKHHAAAADKHIDLRFAGEEDGLYVQADPLMLERIITNLLTNAVRYTPLDGSVTVAARRTPGGCELAVADTGIGIAPNEIKRIFDPFYQVAQERSPDRKGTGLGLAIVKHLVELHGAEISVESNPGSGSRFSFVLPAADTGSSA